MKRKKKISYAEVAKIYDKNESFSHEIVRKEKEIHAIFAFAPQIQTGTKCDKCFI